MIPLLIAAGSGILRAGVGAIRANQEKQRQRGIIGRAYDKGRERLDLHQGDVRQSVGEGLIARGLAGGGAVRDTGRVQPGAASTVTGAHDLGGQAVADLQREQGIEQTGLRDQRDDALRDVKHEYHGQLISSLMSGVQTAVNAYSGASALGAGKALGGVSSPGGAPSIAGGAADFDAGGMPGWGGIDVVNPLGRGAWATPRVSDPSIYRG
jgi:hypothetical protein